jgi:hypothetical protein
MEHLIKILEFCVHVIINIFYLKIKNIQINKAWGGWGKEAITWANNILAH